MATRLYSLHNISVFFSSDSPLPVTSRVCFVKFLESESVGVSQHLTNTVFVDRALIVVPFAEGGCLLYSCFTRVANSEDASQCVGSFNRIANKNFFSYQAISAKLYCAWHF